MADSDSKMDGATSDAGEQAPKSRPPTPAELRRARDEAVKSDPDVKQFGGWVDMTLAALVYEGVDSADSDDVPELEALLSKRRDSKNRKMTSAEISLAHKYALRFGYLKA